MVVGNQRHFFSYIAAHIQEGKKNAILVKDRYQAAAITTYLETLNIPVASQATPNITKGKAFHVLKLGLPPEFSDEGDFANNVMFLVSSLILLSKSLTLGPRRHLSSSAILFIN